MKLLVVSFGLTAFSLVAGCGGEVEGRGGAPGPNGTSEPPTLPACPNVRSAPADRAPTSKKVIVRGSAIHSIVADGKELFFGSEPGSGGTLELSAVPKAGGATRSVAATLVYQLEADGDSLYLGGGGYGVARIGKAGENEKAYAVDAFTFALDDTSIYTTSLTKGEIARVGKDSSDLPVTLARGEAPQGVSVRDGYVYWANYSAKTVARVPATGGATEILATFPAFTREVVVDCRFVYVSVGNYGDEVWRIPVVGGAAERFANVGGTLRLDAASLYVQNREGTWRVSLSSGKVSDLGPGHGVRGMLASSITLDDEAVYWTTGDTVIRAEK